MSVETNTSDDTTNVSDDIMSAETNASDTSATSCSQCSQCPHEGHHYRMPCACPFNDSPHPMHNVANGGPRHHVWCSKCLNYCYKDAICGANLPNVQVPRFPFTVSNGRDL